MGWLSCYSRIDEDKDGDVIESCDEDSSEILKKTSHFTYSFSENKLIVLDIQGSGLQITIQNFLTTDLIMEESEVYFCAGIRVIR